MSGCVSGENGELRDEGNIGYLGSASLSGDSGIWYYQWHKENGYLNNVLAYWGNPRLWILE